MIRPTLASTKGEPVSLKDEDDPKEITFAFGFWVILGFGLFMGLVLQLPYIHFPQILWEESNVLPRELQVHGPQPGGAPVQGYSTTSGLEDYFDRILAPQDQPEVNQVPSARSFVSLMTGNQHS